MRFIFQLLIGMILFNAMLIIFAPYFDNPSFVEGVDVTESDSFTDYEELNIMGILQGFIGTFLLSFFITLFMGKLIGGNIPVGQLLGACLVVSIFVGLWSGLSNPLVGIAGSYPTIMPFYTIFTVVLGVVVMISVVEIFTGKGDETA